ncbi:MAG: DUF5683 domain-containing protein [Flavobacteriales bacterium]
MIKKIGFFFSFNLFLFSFAQEITDSVSNKETILAKKNKPIIVKDTVEFSGNIGQDLEKKLHSPQKAALYSTVLPGLGQIYNKKYIKAGAVLALIGTGIGFTAYYQGQYQNFRNGYINKLNDPNYSYNGLDISAEALASNMDDRRRSRDYAVLLTALAYILNIVDATVDAHLDPVRKDPDLSFFPVIIQEQNLNFEPQVGIGLNFKF